MDVDSEDFKKFIVSIESFVDKHINCGEKCRHLYKYLFYYEIKL